jgi:L-ribulose-5-phosphate 3-epimerase
MPLLAGDVNWPAVRDGLSAVGYDGWMIAEVYPHYRFRHERLIFDTSAAIDAIFGTHPGIEAHP